MMARSNSARARCARSRHSLARRGRPAILAADHEVAPARMERDVERPDRPCALSHRRDRPPLESRESMRKCGSPSSRPMRQHPMRPLADRFARSTATSAAVASGFTDGPARLQFFSRAGRPLCRILGLRLGRVVAGGFLGRDFHLRIGWISSSGSERVRRSRCPGPSARRTSCRSSTRSGRCA